MKKVAVFAHAPLIALLLLVSLLLQREFARGTFDPVERTFVGWLAANTGAKNLLPPLTLVLYDEEASSLAGAPRMGALDVALFARAASRLGAVAAGIEGLTGDPSRMLEAAGRMPVFAGYAPDAPPSMGWTPWGGVPGPHWMELRGLAGRASTRLTHGFFAAPEGGTGPRRAVMVARNSDRVVPSLLALCWAAAQRARSGEASAEGRWLRLAERSVPIDADGGTSFFPAAKASVMTMSEFLVAAEKYERRESRSPLLGHVVVLARATADITRIKSPAESEAATPPELWARAWPSLRQGRCFVLPGWWYQAALTAAGFCLALGTGRRGWRGCAAAGTAALFVYLLVALGVFASAGVLLPFVLSAGTLASGLLFGRFIFRT